MNLQTTPKNALILGFILTSPATPAIKQCVNPVYYVEEIILNDDIIGVAFTLNDEWMDTIIDTVNIKKFVLENGMNDYCFDYSTNGCHVQDCGTLPIDAYCSENLNDVVKAYLKARKVGQNVN